MTTGFPVVIFHFREKEEEVPVFVMLLFGWKPVWGGVILWAMSCVCPTNRTNRNLDVLHRNIR